MAKKTPTEPPADTAAKPGADPAADDRPVPPDTVELVSRYTELRIGEIVRFHNGRATVSRKTFEKLRSHPRYGFGVDFHVFDPPAASAA